MRLVERMSGTWRVGGNDAFNAALDQVAARLETAGVAHHFEEYGPVRTWQYTTGTLSVGDETILSRERQAFALCINSFSTSPGGEVFRLIGVGSGASDADYARKDVTGAVVFGNADVGTLWQAAVGRRGARGVVSTEMAPYIANDPDILQWGSIPYDANRRSFAFKASRAAAARLTQLLEAGPVNVRVTIDAQSLEAGDRTLVAEIPGRVVPDQRIVVASHVQEPGANDNASGCATLEELAIALRDAIQRGAIAQPARTITFLWLDEMRGSQQWLHDHPDQARGVRFMFSLDMTGEDSALTGGEFLVERAPDPSAVWERPSDPHTEWGQGEVSAETLRGTVLNDVYLDVCRRFARATGWRMQSNPYEGGSDHSVFLAAGVPSILGWHFTDRYYHTNFDRADKTSAREMARVGRTVGDTVLLLASGTDADALRVARIVDEAAHGRLAREERQGRALMSSGKSTAATERDIMTAWRKWYDEALQESLTLPASAPSPGLRSLVEDARKRLAEARGQRSEARERSGQRDSVTYPEL